MRPEWIGGGGEGRVTEAAAPVPERWSAALEAVSLESAVTQQK